MKIETIGLPDDRVWLRVASAQWRNPLDPGYAQRIGGRWNPPGTYAVLYLNGDVTTARRQLERMLEGYPASLDDLDENSFVLVAARLPRRQRCADAVSPAGLKALRLPQTYPLDAQGKPVPHSVCRKIGSSVRSQQLRGVWCRSAATPDGRGRELAWFPSAARSRVRPVWKQAMPLGSWRYARQWADLDLESQPDPS